MPPRPLRAAIALLLLAACGHGDLMRVPDLAVREPRGGASPTRLTYNQGVDADPGWLPDGSGILYSSERGDRADSDQCLGLLPPGGGTITRLACDDYPPQRDSTNTFRAASMGPDGRVAFVRSGYRLHAQFPASVVLRVGRLDDVAHAESLAFVPYTLPGAPLHTGISQIRWLDASTLVYRGDFAGTVCLVDGPQCPLIAIHSGRNLVVRPLGPGAGAPRVLPGTDYASSVSVGRDPDEIFFTRIGDGRVYRQAVSTGVTTVLVDFGATIVRDVHYAAGRLVVVTGGTVSAEVRSGLGLIQLDFGGEIDVVNLADGSVSVLSTVPALYLHPALSPDGDRVVAEAGGDLFLFAVP